MDFRGCVCAKKRKVIASQHRHCHLGRRAAQRHTLPNICHARSRTGPDPHKIRSKRECISFIRNHLHIAPYPNYTAYNYRYRLRITCTLPLEPMSYLHTHWQSDVRFSTQIWHSHRFVSYCSNARRPGRLLIFQLQSYRQCLQTCSLCVPQRQTQSLNLDF